MRRFIRLPELKKIVSLSGPTIYRRMAAGEFPRPYDLGGNGHSVAWVSDEIDAWIAARIEAAGRQVA
jgi:prophage regulatory protein